ncbi:hypothetical protein [Helicobacter sp. MIT 14-3879]|uniref:hypothetical protein n=1 Tax=Helicobacter sp. MIT 14-3879 TaxID=2040649 RepID=UPI0015F15E45|nr:hypothetical protein [Helicobacter sp. MIT 14-3879]
MLENKNIPIESFDKLRNEVDFKDFEYKDYFELICKIKPNKKPNKEKGDKKKGGLK